MFWSQLISNEVKVGMETQNTTQIGWNLIFSFVVGFIPLNCECSKNLEKTHGVTVFRQLSQ